jgi:hypothetical protein
MGATKKGQRPVNIERIKSIKKFENISDEEAQEMLDSLRLLVQVALKVTHNQ